MSNSAWNPLAPCRNMGAYIHRPTILGTFHNQQTHNSSVHSVIDQMHWGGREGKIWTSFKLSLLIPLCHYFGLCASASLLMSLLCIFVFMFLCCGNWCHYLNRWSSNWHQQLPSFLLNISSVHVQTEDRKVWFSVKMNILAMLLKSEPQNRSPDVYKLRLLTSGPSNGCPLLSNLPLASPAAHQSSGWILPPTGCPQPLNTGKRVISKMMSCIILHFYLFSLFTFESIIFFCQETWGES